LFDELFPGGALRFFGRRDADDLEAIPPDGIRGTLAILVAQYLRERIIKS
jgi:hypothetical protein